MSPIIANTIHGLSPFVCVSAMQKFIRCGMEREAMEVAVEMLYTSKAYCSWVCKRLQIISHEDIGLAAPHLIPLVKTCCEQARDWWDAKSDMQGKAAMAVGTAIRAMCRADKSREGDHFHCAVGGPIRAGAAIDIPEWCFDNHTTEGKKLGRGIDYFRMVSAVLHPAPAEKDKYEDDAYRIWALMESTGNKAAKPKAKLRDESTKLF